MQKGGCSRQKEQQGRPGSVREGPAPGAGEPEFVACLGMRVDRLSETISQRDLGSQDNRFQLYLKGNGEPLIGPHPPSCESELTPLAFILVSPLLLSHWETLGLSSAPSQLSLPF